MPILLDYSGSVFSSIHVDVKTNNDISKEFLRHLIINQIKTINKKFSDKYGELILCMDSHNGYWRRDYFKYYKMNRKEAREASVLNWGLIFKYVNEITEEVKENLPYKCIQIEKLEADDIIGSLAINKPWSDNTLFDEEKCLIVSSDHDFKQLHRYDWVYQYTPFNCKMVKEENPEYYLIEHILKGDRGDGIPNVRSDDSTFVDKKRQAAITREYIKSYLENNTVPNDDLLRFERNKMLIDLRSVPKEYVKKVIDAYNTKPLGNRNKLFMYLGKNGLKTHLENITDF